MCCDGVACWVTEKQMLIGVIRVQCLWKEGGGNRIGQRENLRCDAGLTNPWPTCRVALEKAFSFECPASGGTAPCFISDPTQSPDAGCPRKGVILGSRLLSSWSWQLEADDCTSCGSYQVLWRGISVAPLHGYHSVNVCLPRWPQDLLSLNQLRSSFFKASCLSFPCTLLRNTATPQPPGLYILSVCSHGDSLLSNSKCLGKSLIG